MEVGHYDRSLQDNSLRASFHKLYESETFSDLTLKCGDRSFRVHRFVLAAQSDWSLKACAGGFKSNSDTIELYEDEPEHVAAMINFCYQGKYETSASKPMTFSVGMFALGEKYLVDSLQCYAADKLSHHILHSSDDYGEDMASAILQAYTSTLDIKQILRPALVHYVATWADRIFGKDISEDKNLHIPQIREAVWRPEFAANLICAMAKAKPLTEYIKLNCPGENCNGTDVRMWSSQLGKKGHEVVTITCFDCNETCKLKMEEWQQRNGNSDW